MQIDHIALWTKDLEKEKDFYAKYFDCSVNTKYENIEKNYSSYFLSFYDGTRIELMNRGDITESKSGNTFGLAHIAISVGTRDKVDNLTRQFEKDGFMVESYPRITGDGYYESVTFDPENNKIELLALDFKIEKASPEDLNQILYLQKCCYLLEAEIYRDYTIPPLTQTIDDIQNDFETQTILKLVYKNKVIGSVRAYLKNNTCFIGKLIVDKDYQNRGFGQALIEEIEQQFKDARRYELFTGYNSTKNLYLYQKLGYTRYKIEPVNSFSLIFLEKLN